jgi:hypothetical protein
MVIFLRSVLPHLAGWSGVCSGMVRLLMEYCTLCVKLCSVLPLDNILVHGKIIGGESHEGRIGGLAIKVRVSLRDLLCVLGFATAVCKWGRQRAQVKFRVLPLKVKIL